jgi:hypothetical protein
MKNSVKDIFILFVIMLNDDDDDAYVLIPSIINHIIYYARSSECFTYLCVDKLKEKNYYNILRVLGSVSFLFLTSWITTSLFLHS